MAHPTLLQKPNVCGPADPATVSAALLQLITGHFRRHVAGVGLGLKYDRAATAVRRALDAASCDDPARAEVAAAVVDATGPHRHRFAVNDAYYQMVFPR